MSEHAGIVLVYVRRGFCRRWTLLHRWGPGDKRLVKKPVCIISGLLYAGGPFGVVLRASASPYLALTVGLQWFSVYPVVLRYRVQSRTEDEQWKDISVVSGDITFLEVGKLEQNTAYKFRLRAEFTGGAVSDWSNEAMHRTEGIAEKHSRGASLIPFFFQTSTSACEKTLVILTMHAIIRLAPMSVCVPVDMPAMERVRVRTWTSAQTDCTPVMRMRYV